MRPPKPSRFSRSILPIAILLTVAGFAGAATVWHVFSPGGASNAVQFNNAGSYQLGGAINTTATNEFLTQSSSGPPAFNVIQGTDVPAANLAASGNAGVTGTLPVGNGGTGATSLTGLVLGNGASPMSAYAGSSCVAGDFVTAASASGVATCALPSYATGANPTASVGLTAVNGSASTFMRSDAAPALSQSISPTMTGNWTFIPTSGIGVNINNAVGSQAMQVSGGLSSNGTSQNPSNGITQIFLNGGNSATLGFVNASAPTDEKIWDAFADSNGNLHIRLVNDAYNVGTDWLKVSRTGATAGSVYLPLVPASTAAQTGYVCFGTGGLLTYDTTNTCLISSAKYKTDMRPLRAALSEVMRLRPISFKYKPKYNPGHLGTQVGFTAESVAKADSRLAAFDPKSGKPRSVQYDHVSVVLVAAMQTQQREIERLKRQVRGLERAER